MNVLKCPCDVIITKTGLNGSADYKLHKKKFYTGEISFKTMRNQGKSTGAVHKPAINGFLNTLTIVFKKFHRTNSVRRKMSNDVFTAHSGKSELGNLD